MIDVPLKADTRSSIYIHGLAGIRLPPPDTGGVKKASQTLSPSRQTPFCTPDQSMAPAQAQLGRTITHPYTHHESHQALSGAASRFLVARFRVCRPRTLVGPLSGAGVCERGAKIANGGSRLLRDRVGADVLGKLQGVGIA